MPETSLGTGSKQSKNSLLVFQKHKINTDTGRKQARDETDGAESQTHRASLTGLCWSPRRTWQDRVSIAQRSVLH